MREVFNTKSFNLIGNVRSVETQFFTIDKIDGVFTETRTEPPEYLLFNQAGCLCEEISAERVMMDGVHRDVYFYNAQGKLSELEEYDDAGELIGKSLFEEDKNGDLVKTRYYVSSTGELVLNSKLTYGPNNEIQRVFYDAKGVPQKGRVWPQTRTTEISKTPSEDGGHSVEEVNLDNSRKLTSRKVTHYDHRGNKTEFSCYKPDGQMDLRQEYSYEFDSVGNWVTKITSHWVIGWGEFCMRPFTSYRRKIEYF